jgi:hypothetical protein
MVKIFVCEKHGIFLELFFENRFEGLACEVGFLCQSFLISNFVFVRLVLVFVGGFAVPICPQEIFKLVFELCQAEPLIVDDKVVMFVIYVFRDGAGTSNTIAALSILILVILQSS